MPKPDEVDNLPTMENDKFLTHFINKQITFRFHKQELRLALTQSLFSSFDIDLGTRLLLKTIAKEIDLASVQTALDMGCGMGTLGIALAKANPRLLLTAQDREALAVAFTQMNAIQNKCKNVTAVGGLAFEGIAGPFDLIVANLPGKVGEPALRHWLGVMAAKMNEGGVTAVVIVKPLAPLIIEILQQQNSLITFTEEGKGHTVIHFKGGQPWLETADTLLPYTRGQFPFKLGKQTLTLRTVYNLPEFDTLGHHTSLAINMLKNEKVQGNVLVWNPGQGHLPLYLQQRLGSGLGHLFLAGRDALSLEISRANLLAHGWSPTNVTLHHVPHILALNGRYDWVVVFPDIDPGVPWEQFLLPSLQQRLVENGRCLLTAKSSYVYRLLLGTHSFRKNKDRKKQGFRALLLQKV